MIIFERDYSAEELGDVERDVYEALDEDFTPEMATIPTDEHGFQTGTFTVKIEWTPNEA